MAEEQPTWNVSSWDIYKSLFLYAPSCSSLKILVIVLVLGRFVKWSLYFAEVEEKCFVNFFLCMVKLLFRKGWTWKVPMWLDMFLFLQIMAIVKCWTLKFERLDIFAESIPRFTDISLLQLVVKMIEVD